MPLPLATERLLIRAFVPADLDALFAIYGDAEVMELAGGVTDRATTERCLVRYIRDGAFAYYALEERATGAVIGECGLPRLGDEVEIGWTLARSAYGRGYATEAARAVLAEALGPLGLEQVVATILPGNVASVRVAEKAGMRADGWMDRDGVPHLRYVAP